MSTRQLMSIRGNNINVKGKVTFDWQDAIFDSLIIAGLTFFSVLGGLSITGIPGTAALVSAGISAMAQFFAMLAIKRGLRNPYTKEVPNDDD